MTVGTDVGGGFFWENWPLFLRDGWDGGLKASDGAYVLAVSGQVSELHHLVAELAEDLHELLEGHHSLQLPQGGQYLLRVGQCHHDATGYIGLHTGVHRGEFPLPDSICPSKKGDIRSGSKLSGSLAAGSFPHHGCVKVSLSKPNPQSLLTSWLVNCMAASRRWGLTVCEWVSENYNCSPFKVCHEQINYSAFFHASLFWAHHISCSS